MKVDVDAPEMRSLLEGPSPATLTLYGEDGQAITSPVWFRTVDGAFEVVIADGDRKLEHLRRDPRCLLVIFEAVPPFRGVQVRGRATIEPDHGSVARLGVTSRYLGAAGGRAFTNDPRRPPPFVFRLPRSAARAWIAGAASPTATDAASG